VGVTLKRQRIAGLMLCRDRSGREPWPMPDQPDSTHLSRKVKEAIRAAGLRDELSFTSFRHGGLTEGGDAELTDRERCWRKGVTPRSRCFRNTPSARRDKYKRGQETPGLANKRRPVVRMSASILVRMES